jgi:hypothetical protein
MVRLAHSDILLPESAASHPDLRAQKSLHFPNATDDLNDGGNHDYLWLEQICEAN